MAFFYPGEDVALPFPVPDLTGSNITGLDWTLGAFFKDGALVTGGAEHASISVNTGDANAYVLHFTPATDSSSKYMMYLASDAAIPDVFQEVFEPNWERLVQLAKTTHDVSGPETIVFYMPDGVTPVETFTLTKSGSIRTSTPS